MPNYSKATKAMLINELVQNRARISVLENQLQAERALHAQSQTKAVVVEKAKPVRPQWQIDRAAKMAAARTLAMQTGQMVVMNAKVVVPKAELPF